LPRFSSHRIKNAGVNDPRNELLIRYYDFVKIFQPKMFLVENVPGLLWEKHKDYLNNFKRLAANSGYNILGPLKLNAKDYGVPQNRNRVFILGLRDIFLSAMVIGHLPQLISKIKNLIGLMLQKSLKNLHLLLLKKLLLF
jgi:site-specific DNA-cytosine methylase